MAKGIDSGYNQEVQQPPARFQESDFLNELFCLHGRFPSIREPAKAGTLHLLFQPARLCNLNNYLE